VPYRELTEPILRYLDEIDARFQNDVVTVVIPEFVVDHWWGALLHNNTALLLKGRLLFREGTVVTSVPYHVHDEDEGPPAEPERAASSGPAVPTAASDARTD
jgi:hypothetical protein